MSKSNTTALIIDKNRAEDEIFYDLERARAFKKLFHKRKVFADFKKNRRKINR